MTLPLRNLPYYNYTHWGQGTPLEYDAEAKHTEPTKVLRLADFNGDGKAWEFRIVQAGGACDHLNTLLAGYSPARRAVVIFPVLAGPFRSDWNDDFFAHPAAVSGSRVESKFPCAPGGSEAEIWQEYLYDGAREAWVMNRHRERACESETASTPGPIETLTPPLTLTVGSAEGAAGEHVSISVSVDTREAPVDRIKHAIVVDPRISVAAIEGLDFESADGGATAAESGVGPINCKTELVETCEWALSMNLDGTFIGKPVLYFLKLAIPRDAVPGTYRLSNVNLSAVSRSGARLPIKGTDGELTVRAAGAPL
jgi:hypothetical protein